MREATLYKKYIQQDSSSNDSNPSSKSSSNAPSPQIIPKFVKPNLNKNNTDELSELEKIKKKQQDSFNYLLSLSKKKPKILDENKEEMIDDTDNPDDLTEYENWKIRELKRIKRDLEERTQREKEKEEIERRRTLTDEQRKEENIKLGSDDTLRNFKSKINYLQKYYHKGAFFQDEASTNSEHIYNRDFNLPTWEDKVDRSNLPSIMNKRRGNLFKKGQTKYTHLTNEDTTNFDPNFKVPDNIVNNILKKSGGYKAQNKFTTK